MHFGSFLKKAKTVFTLEGALLHNSTPVKSKGSENGVSQKSGFWHYFKQLRCFKAFDSNDLIMQQRPYELIDPLFKGVADWALIKTHWKDLMRVVLSIKAGKLMPSTLLRKLNSYSGKNRLYRAFQALGNVIRTLFLLRYFSEPKLRQQITACTNKVELYHQFLDWVFFAKAGLITDNDPAEQEKRLKYLDLVASAIILQNTVDLSQAIQSLSEEGYSITPELFAGLSPYLTGNTKRYGDYTLDFLNVPMPLEEIMAWPMPFPVQEAGD